MSTREDAFEEAKRLREEQRKRDAEKKEMKNQGGGSGVEYDEITYVGLEYNEPRIVRIVGKPMSNRQGVVYSPKAVRVNWLLGDNDQRFRCVWPERKQDRSENWILWKIYDKVMACTWDNTNRDKDGKGEKIFKVQKEHPAIYNRVAYNGDDPNSEYKKSWWPQMNIVMNVIDRQDMDWHRKNKHYKVLSKKIGKGKETGKLYPELGISLDCYNEIFDKVVQYYSDWKDYDILIKKYKTGPQPSDVAYEAICCKELNKIDKSLVNYVVEGDLTEEEESWEKYNFDKIYSVTSYQKILKNLGIFIQSVDSALKTKFYEELLALVEEEKKKWNESNPNSSVETPSSEPKAEKEEVKEAPKRERKPEPVSEKVENKFDINSLDKNVYRGLSNLTDAEKARIKSVNENGSFVYDTTEVLPCTDDACAFEAPEDFKSCPKCGTKF